MSLNTTAIVCSKQAPGATSAKACSRGRRSERYFDEISLQSSRQLLRDPLAVELHCAGQAARKTKPVIAITAKHAPPVVTSREWARLGDATKNPTLRLRHYVATPLLAGLIGKSWPQILPSSPWKTTSLFSLCLCSAWLTTVATQLVSTQRNGFITGSWGRSRHWAIEGLSMYSRSPAALRWCGACSCVPSLVRSRRTTHVVGEF